MPAELDLRRGKDLLVAGAVETQKQVGMIPDVSLAEKWAEPLVDQTDKELAVQKPAVPKPKPEVVSPEEGKRGGLVDWDLQANQLRPLPGAKLKKYFVPRGIDNILLAQRLKLLSKFPEWRKRVLDAFLAPPPPGVELKEALELRTKRVLKVVEASDLVFGERKIREAPKKIIFG